MIRRGFVDLPHGQIHFRRAGAGGPRPLVMLHSNPTSSIDVLPLMRRFAESRAVFAPDTPGLGDSDALPHAEPTIPDYAEAIESAICALGIIDFDLYGSHTGANLAVELALRSPERVKHLVLDGIAIYSPEMKADLLAHYAPEVKPSLDGQHILWAWHFMRDQHLFWPWFRRTADRRRDNGLPTADELHQQVVEVLKGLSTINRAYRASFNYDKFPRLKKIAVPTLLASSIVDIFHNKIGEVAALIAGATRVDLPPYGDADYLGCAFAAIHGFLEAPEITPPPGSAPRTAVPSRAPSPPRRGRPLRR